jgi:uncharacterized repeat protein (TIGR02059 family)
MEACGSMQKGTYDYQYRRCLCHTGFGSSADLSLEKDPRCRDRACPKGRSWNDKPIGATQAHLPAECSDRGVCDPATGLCECSVGFAGSACERTICPSDDAKYDCSGHGKCVNMERVGLYEDSFPLQNVTSNYKGNRNTTTWDGRKIYGCICDSSWTVGFDNGETQVSEWFGYDCGLKHCPSGDDPMTAIDETDCYDKSYNGKLSKVVSKNVELILSAAVTSGQTVTVAYTRHVTENRNIKDEANNAVETFSAQPVTNAVLSTDTIVPTFFIAEVANAAATKVVLTFTENIAANANVNAADFAVLKAGSSATISSAAVANDKVELTLANAVTNGQSVTVAYTKHGTANRNIKDLTGNAVATFSAQVVTNNVAGTDSSVPTLKSAEVTHFAPDTIVLTFNEDIAANANVNKADFAIIITETNSNTAGTNGNGVVATSAKGFVVPSTIGITGTTLGVTTTTAGTAPGTLTLTFTHPVQLVSGNSFVLTLDRKIFTNDGTSTTCTATTGGSSLTLTSKTVSGSGTIMTVVLGATSTAGKQIILACTDNMDNNAAVIGTIIRYGLSATGNGAIKFGSIGYTITDSVSGSETPPTTISTVSISDGKINLILTAPVTDTQSLTISYLKHSTANRNIKDAANNAVATFTLQSVDNNVNAVDVLPPTFNYAEVLHARPNRVIITFTEDIVLNTNINAGDFAVVVAGSSATISSAAVTSVDAAYVAHYDVNGVYAHLTGYGKVGNKCHVECSNRGICDHSNGICGCFKGFIGSACERVDVLAGIN